MFRYHTSVSSNHVTMLRATPITITINFWFPAPSGTTLSASPEFAVSDL